MKKNILILTILTIISQQTFSQNYPTFGNEIPVAINGLTFDAMEPFISLDWNTLFFNSLNSGGNTNLYYATKIDDTTFAYVGLVNGTYDPSPNHLDACAAIDSLNNFFWVSVRDYPTVFENLHRGTYSGGNVTNITRVYGDFNIYSFSYPYGWLIMDGAISYDGNYLYYNNAYFDFVTGGGIPYEARIGVAQRVNDSTFNKLSITDAIFFNVNDTNYLVYAPQVTKDGLELYYTRLLKNTFNTEICVSVRNSIADTFSVPMFIHSKLGFVPEAASPTTDKQKIYFHQKDGTGIFKIYLRYRTGTTGITGINEQTKKEILKVYPNPTNNFINVALIKPNEAFVIEIYSLLGQNILVTSKKTSIDISNFASGIYYLTVMQNDKKWTAKIIKY